MAARTRGRTLRAAARGRTRWAGHPGDRAGDARRPAAPPFRRPPPTGGRAGARADAGHDRSRDDRLQRRTAARPGDRPSVASGRRRRRADGRAAGAQPDVERISAGRRRPIHGDCRPSAADRGADRIRRRRAGCRRPLGAGTRAPRTGTFAPPRAAYSRPRRGWRQRLARGRRPWSARNSRCGLGSTSITIARAKHACSCSSHSMRRSPSSDVSPRRLACPNASPNCASGAHWWRPSRRRRSARCRRLNSLSSSARRLNGSRRRCVPGRSRSVETQRRGDGRQLGDHVASAADRGAGVIRRRSDRHHREAAAAANVVAGSCATG